MVSVTTGGPDSIYQPDKLNGDIHQILFSINHGILRFTGFDVLPPFIVWGPAHVNDDTRKTYLSIYWQRLADFEKTEPIEYPSLKEFDINTFKLNKKEE